MKLWIGVTENDWFSFLARQAQVDEVNFWQPGGSGTFRALVPGEPFLFKLHAPQNFIVGGGFFAHYSRPLPASVVWEAFGQKNGAASLAEMRSRIGKYRRSFRDPREDPPIGCIILIQPFFFDEIDWIPIPSDFSLNIVQGKTYSTQEEPGRSLWARVQVRLGMGQPQELSERESPMFGEPVLVRPRLGQGSFRVLITDTYERRCALAQERALPVLEAAHIRPVTEGGLHRLSNGPPQAVRSRLCHRHSRLPHRGQPPLEGRLRQRSPLLPVARPADLVARRGGRPP